MGNEWEFLTAELAHYGINVSAATMDAEDAWQLLADMAVSGVRAHAA